MEPRRTHVVLAIGVVLTVAVPLVLVTDARSAARDGSADLSPQVLARRAPAPASPAAATPSAPAAAPPVVLSPPDRSPPAAPSEADLTDQVRALVDDAPGAALSAADDCDRRFPAGPLADERSWLRMRALVHLGRIGDARSEAEAFFERFPESPHGASAYRLTGVHPRPRPPDDPAAR